MFSHLTSFLCNVVSLSRVAVVPSGISTEIKSFLYILRGMGLYESIHLEEVYIFCGRKILPVP